MAVDRVNLSRGKASEEEDRGLRTYLEDTRDARDVAFSALDEHKRDHGCYQRG